MKPLILFLVAFLAVDQSTTRSTAQIPPLLVKGLDSLPGLRLLNPSSDLVGGYTVDELRDFGYWPPWVVRDTDRDGRPDVIAVVVKPGAKPEFGVIAVHATNPSVVQWIAPLSAERINGVSEGWAADTIVPLLCIECDSNVWYRWSGRSYEAELYAVGEPLAVATYETDRALGLFARPAQDSKFLFKVEPCTQAIVRRVAGSETNRWYFIETRDRRPARGWIPASFASASECIG
jgi:hypothetical protein